MSWERKTQPLPTWRSHIICVLALLRVGADAHSISFVLLFCSMVVSGCFVFFLVICLFVISKYFLATWMSYHIQSSPIWVALLVWRCSSDAASFVFYGTTCLIRLIEFATSFATFEESLCETSSIRQIIPSAQYKQTHIQSNTILSSRARYTTLHYTTLHYTTRHDTTLHYTTLHNATQRDTTLHGTTQPHTTQHNFNILRLAVSGAQIITSPGPGTHARACGVHAFLWRSQPARVWIDPALPVHILDRDNQTHSFYTCMHACMHACMHGARGSYGIWLCVYLYMYICICHYDVI